MKWLADTNVELLLVRWLRAEGQDVVWGAEPAPGLGDSVLLEQARREERALLTHDLDFGELVFRRRLSAHSIVLMRFVRPDQLSRVHCLQRLWPELVLKKSSFVVLTDDEIRVRLLER